MFNIFSFLKTFLTELRLTNAHASTILEKEGKDERKKCHLDKLHVEALETDANSVDEG